MGMPAAVYAPLNPSNPSLGLGLGAHAVNGESCAGATDGRDLILHRVGVPPREEGEGPPVRGEDDLALR
ncbi:hypothetical protein HQ560_08135, partial [bacterium]|nr:hypothetical protein [bacterium]